MTVHVSKFVALAEPQLLVDRKTRHAAVIDPAGDEASARIVKRTAVEVGLSPVARIVEAHGVQVNPARLRSGQLDACGAPVGLDLVAECIQRRKRARFAGGVNG
jgi:hypothetical protein